MNQLNSNTASHHKELLTNNPYEHSLTAGEINKVVKEIIQLTEPLFYIEPNKFNRVGDLACKIPKLLNILSPPEFDSYAYKLLNSLNTNSVCATTSVKIA